MNEEVVIEKEIDDSVDNENIYSEDARSMLLEDDELTPFEDAFMRGYEEAIE